MMTSALPWAKPSAMLSARSWAKPWVMPSAMPRSNPRGRTSAVPWATPSAMLSANRNRFRVRHDPAMPVSLRASTLGSTACPFRKRWLLCQR